MLKKKKKIGLALGGGSARGFAHIGVLKILERENIPIDLIAGTSMGAVVGALYCAGIKINMLEGLSRQLRRSLWMDWTFPRMGLASGDKLKQLITLLTKGIAIEKMPKKFAAVAADLCKGRKVVLQEGPAARAVRASAAIPGVFCPVEDGISGLVDGAVVERVPVATARELGADIVIAVDVGAYPATQRPQHIFDVITQSLDIMQRDLSRHALKTADVVIAPQLQEILPGHYYKAAEAISAGEKEALTMLPVIRETLEKEGLDEEVS